MSGKGNERPVVPTYCFFQGCYNPEYEAEIRKGKELCRRFNALHPCDAEGQTAVLKELLGEMGRDVVFTPPFWCDVVREITEADRHRYPMHESIKDKFRP